MKIVQIVLHEVRMDMKFSFKTSFGTMKEKQFFIIEVVDETGIVGYGEVVAFTTPWYTEETLETTRHILSDFLIPSILHQHIEHPDELQTFFAKIQRNHMAKAALEGAVWDLYSRLQGISLARALGGTQKEIPVGVAIGIQPTTEQLIEEIRKYLEEGYKRIKIKIMPGYDVEVIRAVRQSLGNFPLMVDANSAYTLADLEHLQKLDEFNLMMIEQPLGANDILQHSQLQQKMQTPICLDESISTVEDVELAIALKACKVINIKVGRVGGLTMAKKMHDLCVENGIDIWCGGMLDAGIGRAHNIAISSLAGFTLPGDTAASNRYWEHDIIAPEIVVENGFIRVPDSTGIGYDVLQERIKQIVKSSQHFR